LRRGAPGAAELRVLRPAAVRVGHPLGVGHRHDRRRRDRLLPLGHHPRLQRSRGGHRDPAHRGHGDADRRGLGARAPDDHLRRPGMPNRRRVLGILAVPAGLLALPAGALGQDADWPKEITFAILSTESAPEIARRWRPMLDQLEKDLKIRVKHVTATDYRGTIEALKFRKAEVGWLGPKAYVEATTNNYANVDAIAQVRNENGSLGYRSCLIVHADS